MKLVIDIPDDEYAEVKALRYPVLLEKAVQDGKPLDEVLDKISAEIKELTKAHCIQVMDREDIPLLALDIIEKYKKEVSE